MVITKNMYKTNGKRPWHSAWSVSTLHETSGDVHPVLSDRKFQSVSPVLTYTYTYWYATILVCDLHLTRGDQIKKRTGTPEIRHSDARRENFRVGKTSVTVSFQRRLYCPDLPFCKTMGKIVSSCQGKCVCAHIVPIKSSTGDAARVLLVSKSSSA